MKTTQVSMVLTAKEEAFLRHKINYKLATGLRRVLHEYAAKMHNVDLKPDPVVMYKLMYFSAPDGTKLGMCVNRGDLMTAELATIRTRYDGKICMRVENIASDGSAWFEPAGEIPAVGDAVADNGDDE